MQSPSAIGRQSDSDSQRAETSTKRMVGVFACHSANAWRTAAYSRAHDEKLNPPYLVPMSFDSCSRGHISVQKSGDMAHRMAGRAAHRIVWLVPLCGTVSGRNAPHGSALATSAAATTPLRAAPIAKTEVAWAPLWL